MRNNFPTSSKARVEADLKEAQAKKVTVSEDEAPTEEVKEPDVSKMTEEERDEYEAKLAVAKALQDSIDNGTAPAARGTPWMPSESQANLIMMFGCQPSRFVLVETRMLYDLFDSFNSRFNPQTLALELPKMLEDLQSDAADAKWEIWRSNQLQTVKLFYEKNKVSQREGFIFCTTHVDNKYQDLVGEERAT